MVAWVRFPKLPTPLFDKTFLLNLRNAIGKAIRLDIHTAQRTRGKFARNSRPFGFTLEYAEGDSVQWHCKVLSSNEEVVQTIQKGTKVGGHSGFLHPVKIVLQEGIQYLHLLLSAENNL
ncbi:hypothetical protein K1719_000603 [Acacia pycnantha]|nr:hypothetical protein K1719_000603 [Acacia pycnantha]